MRELLTNIIKHAKAKNVKVGITKGNDSNIQVGLEDDGIGFDVSKLGLPSGNNRRFWSFQCQGKTRIYGRTTGD